MNASCLDEKGRFKSCPYRVYTDEHKAILRGQGDFVSQCFYPCIGEGCVAIPCGNLLTPCRRAKGGQIMSRVLTVDGSVKIGAYRFPDRKKPCLCVEKGNTCTVYGSFIDTDRTNEFMNELAALVGARDDKERLE